MKRTLVTVEYVTRQYLPSSYASIHFDVLVWPLLTSLQHPPVSKDLAQVSVHSQDLQEHQGM